MLPRLFSLVGATLVLVAYAGSQVARMDPKGWAYLLLNLAGGGILTFFAVRSRDPGLMLMEGSWVVISLAGLLGAARSRRR